MHPKHLFLRIFKTIPRLKGVVARTYEYNPLLFPPPIRDHPSVSAVLTCSTFLLPCTEFPREPLLLFQSTWISSAKRRASKRQNARQSMPLPPALPCPGLACPALAPCLSSPFLFLPTFGTFIFNLSNREEGGGSRGEKARGGEGKEKLETQLSAILGYSLLSFSRPLPFLSLRGTAQVGQHQQPTGRGILLATLL